MGTSKELTTQHNPFATDYILNALDRAVGRECAMSLQGSDQDIRKRASRE
jgi:hypothetical protein